MDMKWDVEVANSRRGGFIFCSTVMGVMPAVICRNWQLVLRIFFLSFRIFLLGNFASVLLHSLSNSPKIILSFCSFPLCFGADKELKVFVRFHKWLINKPLDKGNVLLVTPQSVLIFSWAYKWQPSISVGWAFPMK